MQRRDFIKIFSAAVALSAAGLPAIASSGKKYCVRYSQAYDIRWDEIVNRLDVSSGLLADPNEHGFRGEILKDLDESHILDAFDKLRESAPLIPARAFLRERLECIHRTHEWYGMSWRSPLTRENH